MSCTQVASCFLATEGTEERRQQNQRGESVSSTGLSGGWPSTPVAGDASLRPSRQSSGCVWALGASVITASTLYIRGLWLLNDFAHKWARPSILLSGGGWGASVLLTFRRGDLGSQEVAVRTALRKLVPEVPLPPHCPRAATFCRVLFRATSGRVVSMPHSAMSCAQGWQSTAFGLECARPLCPHSVRPSSLQPAQAGAGDRPWPGPVLSP